MPRGKPSEEQVLSDIFEHLPTEAPAEIILPSEGRFYSSSGIPTIRPITFQDEKEAVGLKKDPNSPSQFNYLLSKCVSNIDVKDLLLVDKAYLVLKLREISYGTDVKSDVECPACNQESTITFDLSKLPCNSIPDQIEDPMTIELPVLKKECKVFIPRVKHENLMRDEKTLLDYLFKFIHSIDGHTEIRIITQVLNKLPSADAHEIIRALNSNEWGVQTKVEFHCGGCGHRQITHLPVSADFFTRN